MNFHQLGLAFECAKQNISANDIPYLKGITKEASKSHCNTRIVASSLATFLDTFNGDGTAPANHLRMISKEASICDELKDTVTDALMFVANSMDTQFIKQAAPGAGAAANIVSKAMGALGMGGNAVHDALTTALLLGVTGGGALGGVKWYADRSIEEDSLDNEKIKSQIEYYDYIAKQLDKKMRKKYNYKQEEYAE